MANSSDIFGISKLEIGAPGDGVMGGSLVEYSGIREGSATLTLPVSDTIKIFSEQRRGAPYRVINAGSADAPMFELKLLGVDLDQWTDLLGGTYTAGTKKWAAPTSIESKYVSLRITTKETDDDGTYIIFEIPYALLTGGIAGTLTFNDLTDIDLKAEAMIPVSSLAVEGDPFTVQLVDNTYLQTFDIDDGVGQLQFAVVVVGGSTLITNVGGQTTINLPNGTYPYTVDATGYGQETGSLVVASAAAQTDVALTATP